MVFSSLIFVFVFLVLNLTALLFCGSIRTQNIVMLVSSLIFYAWGGPKLVFLLCGIFPLVPGSAIYYAAFYIFLNKGAEAAYYAAMTVKLGAAIALGILIAYSLPDCLFGWRHKNAKM